MNNNRWIQLVLLVILFIGGIVGTGYFFLKKNQNNLDKETSLKQIQSYIIEKDHSSAYNLADNLVQRYPEDKNLISLRDALSELLNGTNSSEDLLSQMNPSDNLGNNDSFSTIKPIVPDPDRSIDTLTSNEAEKKSRSSQEDTSTTTNRSDIPFLDQKDLKSNSTSNSGPKKNTVPSQEKTPIMKNKNEEKSVEPILQTPKKNQTTSPSLQEPTISKQLTPKVDPPAKVSNKPAAISKSTQTNINKPAQKKLKSKEDEERKVRIQLFESLDALQTGSTQKSKNLLENLLKEGSITPDYKEVVNLLSEKKKRQARERLENLLGSGIAFPSIDETQSNPKGTSFENKNDQEELSKNQEMSLDNIKNMNWEDPSEREKAQKQLEALLQKDPNNAQALSLLASLLAKKGDLKGSTDLYEKAVALNSNPDDLYALGGLYFKQKLYNKAAEAYSSCLRANPSHTRAYNNLGVSYVMLSQDSKAIDSFKKAVSNEPSYANGYYQLARVYKRNGDLNSALENFEKAYNYDNKKITHIAEYANICLEKKDFQKADSLYSEALKIASDNDTLLYNAAQTKLSLGQNQQALDLINKSLAKSPNNLTYHSVKAEALLSLNRKDEAESEYKTISNSDPSDVNSRIRLSSLYKSQNKQTEAIDLLKQASLIDPNNGIVQNNLGAIMVEKKQYSDGIPYLKKAVDLGIKEANYNLGLSYFEEKDYDNAIKALQSVLEYNPQNWNTIYLLGLSEFRMGNIQKAQERLRNLLSQNPNFEKKDEINQLLNNIKNNN